MSENFKKLIRNLREKNVEKTHLKRASVTLEDRKESKTNIISSKVDDNPRG